MQTELVAYEPVEVERVEAGPTDPQHAEGLVALAIQKGVDVAVLERLVALQERVTERNARASFFAALAEFQERCPEIPKSGKADIVTKSGARFGYSYAPLDGITRTIRPHLKAVGLSYSWDVEPGAEGFLDVVCVLRHVEGHEERARFPVPIGGGGRMSAAQEHGAALTYGKRQSLTSVLGLTTTDDDIDGAVGARVETISREQAADLEALMDEVKADRAKFFRWAGVDTVEKLPKSKYAEAVKIMEAKRK